MNRDKSRNGGNGGGDGDYIWRFPLTPPAPASSDNDPLLEMLRVFLADLLSIGHLTHAGQKVDVDGFVLACDTKTVYEIFPREKGGARPPDSAHRGRKSPKR